jgi:aminopeptidase YwaD
VTFLGKVGLALVLSLGITAHAATDPTAKLAVRPAGGSTLADALADVQHCFDKDEALALVAAIDPYYRMRGNQGYIHSLDALYSTMVEAGFATSSGESGDSVEFRDYGPVLPAWTPFNASLSVYSPDVGVLHSFETEAGAERTFLCGNSFPTGPEGVMAPLVKFEHSKPVESYAGSVVYGSLPAETLFVRAVQQGGALGVISSYLPEYNEPDTYRDSIRYSSVPYDAKREGFGMNVSPAKRDVIERLLGGGMVYVKVVVNARFNDSRSRTLVARLAGTEEHAGTIALVAHIDEPGANDNASGAASTVAMAAGYLRAIRDGSLPRPRRSITFLVGMEFECSREWLRSTSDAVDLAVVIDMVGQEMSSNGAVPLVERMPDPGAIWDRPPLDVHSEWGRGDVRESDLKGSFVNDYIMAAMNARQAETGWPVRSNPFEGGSDHVSFLDQGIPAVLMWHFTDPYYHTSLDRLSEVSADELANVSLATLALVHHFAQAGFGRAEEVLRIVMSAARIRLETEARNAVAYLDTVADDATRRALVSDRERTIMVAWSHWYREAVLSLEDFEPTHNRSEERTELEQHIDEALVELRSLEQRALDVLED